jgi:hypothetical protein
VSPAFEQARAAFALIGEPRIGSMARIDALEGGEDPKQLLAQIA